MGGQYENWVLETKDVMLRTVYYRLRLWANAGII